MAKWQFQYFCKENPRNNEEFRRTVEKMIMAKEKTRERFLDRNNQENNRDSLDRRNFSNNGHQDRKRGPDSTVAMADRTKKFSKFKLKILRIFIVFGTRKGTTQQEIAESSLIGMQEKEKTKIKKRITRRKTKRTRNTKVSNSRREQLQ
jgi:hypothetical protein